MADFGGDDSKPSAPRRAAWLRSRTFPQSLQGATPTLGLDAEATAAMRPDDVQKLWRKRMGEKGWGVPTWPKQYGGGGLSPAAGARAAAGDGPHRRAQSDRRHGRRHVRPDPARVRHRGAEAPPHARRSCRGELRWCQGYSEPGAGSDLASLQTKAEDKGDHFLVNGQKIWTTGAQYADWCFCLVRTDPRPRSTRASSFLLIDMKTPGVETRPIKLINGTSPFCETFFTDVKVPKENLVGPLNGGWTVGKRLLQFERDGQGGSARRQLAAARPAHRSTSSPSTTSASTTRAARRRRPARPHHQPHDGRQGAMRLTVQRAQPRTRAPTRARSAATSIMKNAGTKIGQERAELLLEIMGHQGLGWDGDGFSADEISAIARDAGCSARPAPIYGGSQEIQNNIISKRILGLPDTDPFRPRTSII